MGAAQWPQPREGIHGTDRDDDLLSLDERAIPHREALMRAARQLRTTMVVGHRAPVVTELWERLSHPQPGDLAVTVDALFRRDPDDRLKGLGIFLAQRDEWAETDAEWETFCAGERAVTNDPDILELTTSLDNRTTERGVFYLQYGPSAGDVVRWVNAEVMTVVPVEAA